MNEENKAVIKALNMYGRVPETWELLEEIERLNKKIEQYENPEDMTLMFMWCDEKAKDEIKRLNNIINELERYINEEYIYDELGMKIFDASKLQDKLQELKGSDSNVKD